MNFPRSYGRAAKLLHDRRIQTILLNDDVVLTFAWKCIVIVFRDVALVQWPMDGRRILLRAGTEEWNASQEAVDYISHCVPKGYKVHLNRARRMMLHHPDGRTTMGNSQQILFGDASVVGQ